MYLIFTRLLNNEKRRRNEKDGKKVHGCVQKVYGKM